MILRFIPGVLWFDFLDDIVNQCHGTFPKLWGCSWIVALIWMTVLGEVRIYVARGVQYVDKRYYQPNKVAIKKQHWDPWPIRFLWISLLCTVSYSLSLVFQKPNSVDENGEGDSSTTTTSTSSTSHMFVSNLLEQGETIVWMLGTVLQLHRKRFTVILIITWLLRPFTRWFIKYWIGNYTLWLCIGCMFTQLFDLVPPQYWYAGISGCWTALLISLLHYWKRPNSTTEMIVAVTSAVVGEFVFCHLLYQLNYYLPRILHALLKMFCLVHGPYNPSDSTSRTNRIWNTITSYLVDDDNNRKESSSTKMTTANKATSAQKNRDPNLKQEYCYYYYYTKPSFASWIAIVIGWIGLGIQMEYKAV